MAVVDQEEEEGLEQLRHRLLVAMLLSAAAWQTTLTWRRQEEAVEEEEENKALNDRAHAHHDLASSIALSLLSRRDAPKRSPTAVSSRSSKTTHGTDSLPAWPRSLRAPNKINFHLLKFFIFGAMRYIWFL